MILAVFIVSFVNAQSKIDSLKIELHNVSSGNSEISLLIDIAIQYVDVNSDSAFEYLISAKSKLYEAPNLFNEAQYHMAYGLYLTRTNSIDSAIHQLKTSYGLFFEIDSLQRLARIKSLIGNCFDESQKYDSALFYYNVSLKMTDSIENKSLLAANYNNMGNVYDGLGDYENALNHYFSALSLFRELKKHQEIAIALNNIALININLNNIDKSISFLNEAIQINIDYDNMFHLCMNYNNLGIAYKTIHDYENALQFFTSAASIADKAGFEMFTAQSNHSIGSVFLLKNKYELALKYFEKSLSMCREIGIVEGEVFNLVNIGIVYSRTNDYISAKKYFLTALDLVQNDLRTTLTIYEELFRLNEESGKFNEAVVYYKLYESVKDSLINIENTILLNEIQSKYESEQKELENQKLKDENKLQEFVIFRQRILVFIAALIASIAILLLIMIVSIRKKRKERIALLQAKNKLISESSLQLKESNTTKDKLFSIIAHDLRSPFTSLLGFSSLLKEEAESGNFENVVSYSQQLSSVATNTYELIDNLLNWTRSQQNSIKPNPNPLNLFELVSKIVQSIQVKANEKKISIITNIDETTEVVADKNMLQVIFRNLLSNALKFTYNGGKITIECEEKPDLFVISVADNGEGIESEIMDNLFLDNSGYSTIGTENEQGSGLGLMLVKDFAQRIGGTIWVESTPEKGSIFSFTIPKVVTS